MEKLNGSQESFAKLRDVNWEEKFYDSGQENWRHYWFLDGIYGPNNTEKGMKFHAGPTFGEDADHAVLWTKEWFKGNVKIEYEYTRLDKEIRCVNILYIQATGKGEGPFTKDIAEWQNLRKVPAMSRYFNNMNSYHISYAAFPNQNKVQPGYIRARRYIASELDGTGIEPGYDSEGFFNPDEKHKITAIKWDDHLYFKVENANDSLLCYWHNVEFPSIEEGRIGLRHMFTRKACYKDLKIFVNK